MNDEFGVAYAAVLEADLVLTELGDRTGAAWHGLNKNTKK
jgi:hypothetical protein